MRLASEETTTKCMFEKQIATEIFPAKIVPTKEQGFLCDLSPPFIFACIFVKLEISKCKCPKKYCQYSSKIFIIIQFLMSAEKLYKKLIELNFIYYLIFSVMLTLLFQQTVLLRLLIFQKTLRILDFKAQNSIRKKFKKHLYFSHNESKTYRFFGIYFNHNSFNNLLSLKINVQQQSKQSFEFAPLRFLKITTQFLKMYGIYMHIFH
eukprot:TRINITY_DN10322_c0_g2_i2.p1 TRINITY_DN10322_c0_g2~~TRINITY_DN10322_c0_g2_i2.p1  ORF type:complete len:207 (-),score=-17.93 TRINITY_DN10322_c0_g2_i2:233-853(-)